MPLQATVCKILGELNAGSPVDHIVIKEWDRSSKRKTTSPNFYAQAPSPKIVRKTT